MDYSHEILLQRIASLRLEVERLRQEVIEVRNRLPKPLPDQVETMIAAERAWYRYYTRNAQHLSSGALDELCWLFGLRRAPEPPHDASTCEICRMARQQADFWREWRKA